MQTSASAAIRNTELVQPAALDYNRTTNQNGNVGTDTGGYLMNFSRRDFVAALLFSGAGAAFAADTASSGAAAAGESAKPVFVVATIDVVPGKRAEFIEIFKGNVPNVLAEDGCIFYDPVVDFDSGIASQAPLRGNTMTVVEKWASIDALRAHLKAPHMNSYREKVKDLVAGVTLQVMQPA